MPFQVSGSRLPGVLSSLVSWVFVAMNRGPSTILMCEACHKENGTLRFAPIADMDFSSRNHLFSIILSDLIRPLRVHLTKDVFISCIK